MSSESGPARILLVEDNPGDARLVSMLLEQSHLHPVHIVHVTRLAEAAEQLERERFDAVLLDLGLPDSSGLDTIGLVRDRLAEAPLVVLSGCDDRRVRERATELGAADYVVKDELDSFRLERCLEAALTRARLASALDDAERTIRSSDARLVDLMVHAFEPMLVLSRDSRVLFANRAAGETLGVPPDRLMGRTLRLPVGDAETEWIETTSIGTLVSSGRVAVRSVPARWGREHAWLVVLDTGMHAHSPAERHATVASAASPHVAAAASELHARALRTGADVETASAQIVKARELLRGWARQHSPAEIRALMDEVLEVAVATLEDASHEIERVQRIANHVLRESGGAGRVLELGTIDSVVGDAVKRAAVQIGSTVRVKFDHHAAGVLATDVPRVGPLVEDLVVGLGRSLLCETATGIDVHVQSKVISDAVVLTFDLDGGERSTERAARLVARLGDRMTEPEGAIDRVVRGLRELGGQVSFGKRPDGTVWVELHVPASPGR